MNKKLMEHKITHQKLKKYDISQKVIESLADTESRSIIFSIVRKGKTASTISTSLKLPLSSVYKKLSELENLTLIEVEKYNISNNGRRFKVYRSRIKKAEILIKKAEPILRLLAN